MKKYIFILTLITSNTFAQTQMCPTPLSNIDIQVNTTPIQFDYDKTSKQMQHLDGQANPNLLGLYQGAKRIIIQPYIEANGINGQYCAAATKIKVHIEYQPKIFISKEAQQFYCTKQRTEQHEELHHKFELSVAANAKPTIEKLTRYYYGQNFTINSKEQMQYFNQQRSQALMRDISEYLKKSVEPLHAKIDNAENYKYESSFCSYQENIQIAKILKESR